MAVILLCALLPPTIVTPATLAAPRPLVAPHRAAIGMSAYAEDGAPRMWLARPEAPLELREAKAALAVFTSCAVGVWRVSLAVTRLAALQAALAARAAAAALVAQVSLAQAVAIALSPRARGRVATAAQPAAGAEGESAVEAPEGVPAGVELPWWSSSTDPLTLLGVTHDASTAQLKDALRERARLFHPDRHLLHTRVYEELFQRITCAYEQLCVDANECAVIEPHAASSHAAGQWAAATAVAEPTETILQEPMYTDAMFSEPVASPFSMYVTQPTATPEASRAPKATPRKPASSVAEVVVVSAWRDFEVKIPISESERRRGVYTYAPCQGLF